MKRILSIVLILFLIMGILGNTKVFAEELDTLEVDVTKTTVRPGEDVTLNINFGKQLGAYTFDIAYDSDIFEYQSVEGGTANDTKEKVRVAYYDTEGGTNPRESMSITFKAKEDITTINPTEFMITAEGLANADASVTYDNITIAIVKNITVSPEYIDYTLNLQYTGDIIKGEEKEMTISYSSPIGKYYEKARLVATSTEPAEATLKLLATDEEGTEIDILKSGWGDTQGYEIGGEEVSQTLNVRALFSDVGEYTITLKLIDRENGDTQIASKTFTLNVKEEGEISETPGQGETQEQGQTPEQSQTDNQNEEQPKQEKPQELPKTGTNIYISVIAVIVLLTSLFIYFKKESK